MSYELSLMRDYKKLIEQINDSADAAIDVLRQLIQKELINPFCAKYRVTFWSAMGGYGFRTRFNKDLIEYNDDQYHIHPRYKRTQAAKDLESILKILDLKGHPNDSCSIGCYMADYP